MRLVRETRRDEQGAPLKHRHVAVAPLAPSLKKAPSPLAQKWSAYVAAIGLKEGSGGGRLGKKAPKRQRHVRFDEKREEFDSPAWTDEEKTQCHYSSAELGEMAASAKDGLHRESWRVGAQSTDTILEQGFLALQSGSPFFQHRQHYCLLRGYRLGFYASAAHAARSAGLKLEFNVLRVQDVQLLSMQKKIAMFGANLPSNIGHLFYVIKANGERVVLTAESRSAKRNWVHTLGRVTYVGEGAPSASTGPLLGMRTRSCSAPASCSRDNLAKITEEPQEETCEPEEKPSVLHHVKLAMVG